ncbi:MAG: magnesium and cobalt transport protein CorA [Actinomycetota bacterium]|nr:magnesium and cobalt transport protein CorA [Actinomycetota bacterium]
MARTTESREGSPASGSPSRDAVVGCAVYVNGRRLDARATLPDAVAQARATGGFVWVGLHAPDAAELAAVAQQFALHPLAVEDAVHAHQRPKLDVYGDDLLFVVLKTVRYCPHEVLTATSEVVEVGEVMVFVGPDFVVTVRHGEHNELSPLRARLEGNPELLCRGPSAVLHAVADVVVDRYLEVAGALDDDLEDLESAVFSARRDRRDVERIYLLKRELMEFRRAVAPLDVPLRMLAARAVPLVDPTIREYFRDVEDHLIRAREQINGHDELLTSMLQASLAQLTVAQNEDVRKITAWAAIIAVPTAVAGIYGMNFDYMPELRWRYGYPLVLLLMFTVCYLLYRGFRRNGWL